MSTGMRMGVGSVAERDGSGGRARRPHPPLQGEGRTAESSPGWGGSRRGPGSAIVESLSPPPASSETEEATSPLQGEVEQGVVQSSALYRLMTFMSPAYPVGAFSYSSGIEWAVEAGDIHDADTLCRWLATIIRHGSVFCDAALFGHAHHAAAACDDNALAGVAELAAALVASKERFLETTSQGQAFVQITRAAWPSAALDRLTAAWDGPLAYPVAVATACAGHGIDLAPALLAFLHGVASNLISAGVRLIPLGQTAGQRVLAALEAAIAETATRATATTLDDIGSATLRADIAGMRHETQYTRLFRS
jgi:urease accessory protein